jgi:replicative DNA helicase
MIDDGAQRLYLSTMLGNPALFARVQHLLKPSFFDSSLQDGVSFLKEFYGKYRGVPSMPVFQVNTKLTTIEAVQLPQQDVKYVAEQIAGFCQIRAVTEAVLKAPALIEKGDFGKMVEQIKLATQVQLHSDLGIDYFADPTGRLEESEVLEVLISTGWDDVDELIGGLGRQELCLFTANSGGGKSVAMLNLAYNLLSRGMHGVYISLEMRDRVVAKRLDSMISRISGKNIFANKLKVGQEVELFKESSKGRFFIKRMREGSTTADHIASYLRELEAVHGFKPDFVVVDYIDLMASVQKHDGSNMFTKDKFVTEEVRAIGFDFDCLMISASQLGRGAIVATREEKAIGQDHIQGGISKINTSDLVIALVKDEAMDIAGMYRFEFLKARNSNAVNKKIEMAWDSDSLRISDMSKKALKPNLRPKGKVLALGDTKPGQAGDGLQALLGR